MRCLPFVNLPASINGWQSNKRVALKLVYGISAHRFFCVHNVCPQTFGCTNRIVHDIFKNNIAHNLTYITHCTLLTLRFSTRKWLHIRIVGPGTNGTHKAGQQMMVR